MPEAVEIEWATTQQKMYNDNNNNNKHITITIIIH